MEIAPKIKTTNTVGTQQQKIVWSNQSGNITTATGEADTAVLKAEYDALYGNIIARKFAELKESLGIDEAFKYESLDKVKELLRENGLKNKMDDDFFEALDSGNSFDANKYRNRIEQILFSTARAKVVNLKRNGGAGILVASTGLETAERNVVDGVTMDNEFAFYSRNTENGITSKAEIALALPEVWQPYVDSVGGLAVFNRMIAEGEIDEELITYYGYRIPTDDTHALDVAKVKYFLPRTFGEAILAPSELVAKAGSDYDVDKLNFFAPYLVMVDGQMQLQTEGEAGDWNRLQQIAQDVVLAPENFGYLITPTTTDPLKARAKRIRELKGLPAVTEKMSMTRTIEYNTVFEMGKNFWAGKSGVGIAAVHRTFHALAGMAQVYFEGKPTYPSKFDGVRQSVRLGEVQDVAGKNISETIGMFLNGYVDIVKEPFVFDIGATMQNINVMFKMVMDGAELDYYTAFLNQPIIGRYNELRLNNSAITANRISNAKIMNMVTKEFGNVKNIGKKNFVRTPYTLVDMEKMLNPMQLSSQMQATILHDYILINKQSSDLSKMVNATTDDSKGAGMSFAENFVVVQQKMEARNVEMYSGYQTIFEQAGKQPTMMGNFRNTGTNKTANLFDPLFLSRKGENLKVLNEVSWKVYMENFKKTDVVKAIDLAYKEYFNFMVQQGPPNILTDNYPALFMGEKSVARRLLKAKKHEIWQKNFVIQELTVLPSKDFKYIKMFSRKKSKPDIEKLRNAFKELYEANPTFAIDLARVGILQSGLANSPIGFVDIIPSEIFNMLTENQIGMFESGENAAAPYFMNLLHMNNASNPLLVKQKSEEEQMYGPNDDAPQPMFFKDGNRIRNTYTEENLPVTGDGIYLRQYMKNRYVLDKYKSEKEKVEDRELTEAEKIAQFIKDCERKK